jgi:hypothetical protein
MMSIDKLKPATDVEIAVYLPYYAGPYRKKILPYALCLYQQGAIEGERIIQNGDNIPFVATWEPSALPSDDCTCRVQFMGDATFNYEMILANVDYIEFLMKLILKFHDSKRNGSPITDFSIQFYRKLFGY